jgi:hypothetical protein
MSERTLIDYMIGGMGTRWRWPVKHADPYTPGIADMSGFVVGVGNVFIEAKALDRWPARDGTIVKLTRYTDDQRYFLINRNGFLLLRVVRDYLLFYGAGALLKAGNVTKGELFDLALGFWKGSVDWNELVKMIKEVRPNE